MADLAEIYRHAVRARLLDERLTILARAGRIGHHPDAERAELVVVAATMALDPHDWIVPTPRDHAAALVRGASLAEYLDHVVGNARDRLLGHGSPGTFASRALRIASPSVQVSQHLSHAVGLAWAARLRKTNEAVLAFLPETAADAGDFHSALNFAGVVRAPVVFLVKTDGNEAPAPDVEIHDKAVAYGIHGEECPAHPGVVFERVSIAVARARAGEGPTLLEVRISTDPDPLTQLRAALLAEEAFSEEADFAMRRDIHAEIEAATVDAMKSPPPAVETLFDHVFDSSPSAVPMPHLALQRESLRGPSPQADAKLRGAQR